MKTCEFSRKIHSNISEIEDLIEDCEKFLKDNGCKKRGPIRTVIREMLINAYEHGNQKDPNKSISLMVELLPDHRCKITVKDEGAGFEYHNVDFNLKDTLSERARGLIIVNSLADNIKFNDNGASVSVYMSTKEKTQYDIKNEDNSTIVECSGDITAQTAENLKELLLNEVCQGSANFKFNMQDVNDIDSIGLSVLIALYNSLKNSGKEFSLEIINANDDCKELFRIIKLDTLYKIY